MLKLAKELRSHGINAGWMILVNAEARDSVGMGTNHLEPINGLNFWHDTIYMLWWPCI